MLRETVFMITVTLSDKKFNEKASAYIVLLTQDEVKDGVRSGAADVLQALWGDEEAVFKAHGFTGKNGSSVFQVGYHKEKAVPVVCVSLGDPSSSDDAVEDVRRACGTGYNLLKKTKAETISVLLPDAKTVGTTQSNLVEQATTIFHIASYAYTEFKSGGSAKKDTPWQPTIVLSGINKKHEKDVKRAEIIATATNTTRGFADCPPNIMTPQELADQAKKVAKDHGLTYTCFDQEKAKELGMGCYYSVAKGSSNPGQFVTLEYKGKKGAPTIAFVGKGVCFDTGGISLKPANAMSGMKYDMSGAAAVIGAMKAIAQLKPDVHVVGITPLVENMPSACASKQDDVVTAMNGKTVEIINTDAEGRLILADALVYAEQTFKPEAIIDIATLTGACAYFLGSFYAGLFTRDDALAGTLTSIGKKVGDKLWQLPLSDQYAPALDSPIADLANCGNQVYKAGATTAALFLGNFVDKKTQWAHLDIAGTDSKIPGTTYLGKGATGTGVRILVEYALSYGGK